ncbi:MAG: RNA ligase family protein, partial [Atribacterota bacterium]
GNIFNECKGSHGDFENSKTNRRGHSIVNQTISDFIIDHCEKEHKKTITERWVNELGPIALAFWYMDDGSANFTGNQRARAKFATNSFSEKEVKILQKGLKRKYNINSRMGKYGKGIRLELDSDSTEKLFALIFPFIGDDMKYKLHPKYKDFPCVLKGPLQTNKILTPTEVLDVSTDLPKRAQGQQIYQYDLNVEDNSNYFTNHILVHNTNLRIIWDAENESIEIKGKTDKAQIPQFLLDDIKPLFRVDKFKSVFGDTSVCLYGEGYGCLSGNTNILLANGTSKTIAEIVNKQLDVKVLTYNLETDTLEPSNILNYYKYPKDKLIKIELEKTRKGGRGRYNQIVCTEDHRIYTDKGYKSAKDIVIGDKIMTLRRDLSFIQKQVLYGTLMGDSSINTKNTINIVHSIKQLGYINVLKKIFSNIPIHEHKKASGYGSNIISLAMCNKEMFKSIVSDCIIDNKKTLNPIWLNNLTPIALAFWYMDDGSIDNLHRKNQRACIATQGFTKKELELLQSILFSKYQIRGKLKKVKNKNQYSIVFSTRESEIFFMLIAPYIIKELKYKLPKYLRGIPCIFDNLNNDILFAPLALKKSKVKNITIPKNNRTLQGSIYDLQTKNENFFVSSGFLVHNSKIQKGGGNYLPDRTSFILFDILIGKWWLKRSDIEAIAKELDIDIVPIIGYGILRVMVNMVKDKFPSMIGNCIAEGLVAKPKYELFDRSGKRVITKLKCKDFK